MVRIILPEDEHGYNSVNILLHDLKKQTNHENPKVRADTLNTISRTVDAINIIKYTDFKDDALSHFHEKWLIEIFKYKGFTLYENRFGEIIYLYCSFEDANNTNSKNANNATVALLNFCYDKSPKKTKEQSMQRAIELFISYVDIRLNINKGKC